jgi:hypothetical protein
VSEHDVTCLVYGAPGTGKSHTLYGPETGGSRLALPGYSRGDGSLWV